MDDNRFDAITRLFANSPVSRRAALAAATGLLAALGLGRAADAQVTQAQCGNRMCAANPAVCTDGCVCCVYTNPVTGKVFNSRCRPPGTCAPGAVACPAGQVPGPSGVCVTQITCTQFVLFGGRDPDGAILVDDDFEVYLNGALIASDRDGGRTFVDPIAFVGKTGDQLRIVAIDAQPDCRAFDPLSLECVTTGAIQVLEAVGPNDGCDPTRALPAVYYDRTFTIAL